MSSVGGFHFVLFMLIQFSILSGCLENGKTYGGEQLFPTGVQQGKRGRDLAFDTSLSSFLHSLGVVGNRNVALSITVARSCKEHSGGRGRRIQEVRSSSATQ